MATTTKIYSKNSKASNQRAVYFAYGNTLPVIGARYLCTRINLMDSAFKPHLTNTSVVEDGEKLDENIFLVRTGNSDNFVITDSYHTFFALVEDIPQVLKKLQCKRLVYKNSESVPIESCTTSVVLEVSYIKGLFRVKTSSKSTYFCLSLDFCHKFL